MSTMKETEETKKSVDMKSDSSSLPNAMPSIWYT